MYLQVDSIQNNAIKYDIKEMTRIKNNDVFIGSLSETKNSGI